MTFCFRKRKITRNTSGRTPMATGTRVRSRVTCELLEQRLNLAVFWDFEVIANTSGSTETSLGNIEFSSIGRGPSINDMGYVAFVGESEVGEGVHADNIYAMNPVTGDVNHLMDDVFMYSNEDAGTSLNPGTQTLFGEVQINNSNDVLVRRRLNAHVQVGFPFGQILTAPLTYLETWNADAPPPPRLPNTLVATGLPAGPSAGQWFFLNPVTGQSVPSPLDLASPFEGLFTSSTIDNAGNVNFSAIVRGEGNNRISSNATGSFFSRGGIGDLSIDVMLADNGFYVFSTDDDRIFVEPWDYSQNFREIAGASSGFSEVSEASISDDGTVIAFTGVHNTNGEGVFVSLFDGNNYSSPKKVVGVATPDDGNLEFGETIEFDEGRFVDRGGFSDFALDGRPGVNNWAGPESREYVIAFKGTRQDSPLGLHTVVISPDRIRNDLNGSTRDLLKVIEIGDTDSIFAEEALAISGAVTHIRLHDSVNRVGQLAFWVETSSGDNVVLKASPALQTTDVICDVLCSAVDRIDRWWATAGDPMETEITVNLSAYIPTAGQWSLNIDIDGVFRDDWRVLGSTVELTGPGVFRAPRNYVTNTVDLGPLVPGNYSIALRFSVPTEPVVEPVTFELTGTGISKTLETLFIADHSEVDFTTHPVALEFEENGTSFSITTADQLIDLFRPILHFDDGSETSFPTGPERFQMPFSVYETFEFSTPKNGDRNASFSLSPFDPPFGTLASGADVFTPFSFTNLGGSEPAIYASVVERETGRIFSQREIAINYYFHFPISNWAEHGGRNSHGGDWEGVTVFLEETDDNLFAPVSVAYGQHVQIPFADGGGELLTWGETLRDNTTHPNVFVGLGGHASYPSSGISPVFGLDEFHRGNASTFFPSEADVVHLERVGDGLVPDWQLYPGTWGNQDEGVPSSILGFPLGGDDGIQGPVFLNTFLGATKRHGERWIDPWDWADSFDDDVSNMPVISIADSFLVEGTNVTNVLEFVVTLHGQGQTELDSPVTVSYSTSNGTASIGDGDYVSSSGSLTFTELDSTSTISVEISGDTKFETDEDLFVNLSLVGSPDVVVTDPQGRGVILNDDPEPTVMFSDADVLEGDSGLSELSFDVTLSNPSFEEISVSYSTTNGSAEVTDNDYQQTNGTITFAPGQISQTVPIAIVGDEKFEETEDLFVDFTLLSGVAMLPMSRARIQIVDEDPVPTVTVASAEVVEGDSGTSNTSLTFSLSNPSFEPIGLDWATVDGSATTSDNDYPFRSGSITFEPNTTNVTVAAAVGSIGDTKLEPNESYVVSVDLTSGMAIVGTSQVSVQITNDDQEPTISIGGVSRNEGNAGVSSFSFPVTLSNPSSEEVSVSYATVSGSATTGEDFADSSGTLEFAPGQTSASVSVNVFGDILPEATESFSVVLSNPQNAGIAVNSAIGIITNDDEIAELVVEDVVIHGGEEQRSNISTIAVTFNQATNIPVLISTGAIVDAVEVHGITNNIGEVDLSSGTRFEWNSLSNQLTIDLTVDGFGGSDVTFLPDDNYELRLRTESIRAALTDVALRDTDGLDDGVFTSAFHRLAGDFDGDRDVAIDDRAFWFDPGQVRFGSRRGQSSFSAAADLDGDGVISARDYFFWLRGTFGNDLL